MSGETIVVYGTTKTLEASGASIANNALSPADDATYGVVADGASYPDAEFVVTATFSVAPTENSTLALFARPLDVDGTADTEAPETTRPTRLIGAFVLNNVTSTQCITLAARDLPKLASYYLYNNGTGQTLASGWVLKVTPISYSSAA